MIIIILVLKLMRLVFYFLLLIIHKLIFIFFLTHILHVFILWGIYSPFIQSIFFWMARLFEAHCFLRIIKQSTSRFQFVYLSKRTPVLKSSISSKSQNLNTVSNCSVVNPSIIYNYIYMYAITRLELISQFSIFNSDCLSNLFYNKLFLLYN